MKEESEVKSEEDYSKRVKWTGKPSEIKVNFHERSSGPTNILCCSQIRSKLDRDWKVTTAWVGCAIAMGISKNLIYLCIDTTWKKLSVVADRVTRDRSQKSK